MGFTVCSISEELTLLWNVRNCYLALSSKVEKSYKKFSKTSQSLNIKVVYSFITSECFNPTAFYNILEHQNLYLLCCWAVWMCTKKVSSHRHNVTNSYLPLYSNPQILRLFFLKIIYSKIFVQAIINYFWYTSVQVMNCGLSRKSWKAEIYIYI